MNRNIKNTKYSLVGIALIAGLSACAGTGANVPETAAQAQSREQLAREAMRDPDDRGVGGRPAYQTAEQREALQHTLTLCIDANDASIASLPPEATLADREVYLQRGRELIALKSRYSAIEARRQSNYDRMRDHNASYSGVMGGDPGLQSRSGLATYYGPYGDSKATELPGVPDYCLTADVPAAPAAPAETPDADAAQ